MARPVVAARTRFAAWRSRVTAAAMVLALAGPAVAQTTAPREFRVADLEIFLSHQEGNAAYRPRELTIAGSGGATFARAGKTWRLQRSPAEALTLLNELFQIRFFDLPEYYGTSDFATLGSGGTVRLIQRATSSSGGKKVCVRIAAFQKCVRFGPAGPVELDRILMRTLDAAEQSARAAATDQGSGQK